MATKVDRTHIRDPFDVDAEYDRENGEVVLTFTGGDYPNLKEVVIHMRVWFMLYIVRALKIAFRSAKEELGHFEDEVKGGV
jgi:hypothetical protein